MSAHFPERHDPAAVRRPALGARGCWAGELLEAAEAALMGHRSGWRRHLTRLWREEAGSAGGLHTGGELPQDGLPRLLENWTVLGCRPAPIRGPIAPAELLAQPGKPQARG